MGLSFSHIVILLLVTVLLFGRGKISELMGDVAKGIKSFKQGLAEDEQAELNAAKQIGKDDAKRGSSPAEAAQSAPSARLL